MPFMVVPDDRVDSMPTSLRIPPEKEKRISVVARRQGQTKSAFILAAIDEKRGLVKDRQTVIRRTAGWMDQEAARELIEAVESFNAVAEDDWP